MSRKIVLFSVLVLAALLLSACAQVAQFAQSVVILPQELQLLITSAFVFAVGWVFVQIGARLPWLVKLFGQYQDEIAFALAGAVIAAIQNWLNMIPPAWETVGNLAIGLFIAVLAALQVFRFLGKAGVKSFKP